MSKEHVWISFDDFPTHLIWLIARGHYFQATNAKRSVVQVVIQQQEKHLLLSILTEMMSSRFDIYYCVAYQFTFLGRVIEYPNFLFHQISVNSCSFPKIDRILCTFNWLISRVFLLRQLWIVNYYIKSSPNNLSNENINNGVSVVFKTKRELKCQNHCSGNASIYVFISDII